MPVAKDNRRHRLAAPLPGVPGVEDRVGVLADPAQVDGASVDHHHDQRGAARHRRLEHGLLLAAQTNVQPVLRLGFRADCAVTGVGRRARRGVQPDERDDDVRVFDRGSHPGGVSGGTTRNNVAAERRAHDVKSRCLPAPKRRLDGGKRRAAGSVFGVRERREEVDGRVEVGSDERGPDRLAGRPVQRQQRTVVLEQDHRVGGGLERQLAGPPRVHVLGAQRIVRRVGVVQPGADKVRVEVDVRPDHRGPLQQILGHRVRAPVKEGRPELDVGAGLEAELCPERPADRRALRALVGGVDGRASEEVNRAQHSHNTVTAQSQSAIGHSTVTAHSRHSHNTVTAQSQRVNRGSDCKHQTASNVYSHSTVTAQP